MSDRKSLLETLKDTVEVFKSRKTVGRMKTEHSIFIPTTLMIEQEQENREFVLAVKKINETESWHCPVVPEQREIPVVKDGKRAMVAGVDFVFTFSPETDFDAILNELESRLKQ